MKPITTIALKEFSENLRSIRFTLLFSLFILMLLLSAYQGAQEYQKELKSYNEMMRGDLGANLGMGIHLPKPSILNAFIYLLEGIITIGGIIGIVIGFDAISGEREHKTLSLLLTQPLYRDDLINGKLLGFILLVITVVLVSSLFSWGTILILTGVQPQGDDALRIVFFLILSFLYTLTFVTVGIFFSVLLKKSVNALLASIAVFIVFTVLINPVAEAIASIFTPIPAYTFTSAGDEIEGTFEAHFSLMEKIQYISPSKNFDMASKVILDPYFERDERKVFGKQISHGLYQSLDMIWDNIMAMLVTLTVFFISSYAMFLKQDIT